MNSSTEQNSHRKLRVLSLFSGCGGMDLGLEGGFRFLGNNYKKLRTETIGAYEFDSKIAEIYLKNFKSPCHVENIINLKASDFPSHDILTGGFPCQSFSIVAQNPPRLGQNDERGRLFFEMCKILRHHKPKCFVAENVKGILSANNGLAFPLILKEFQQSGYFVKYGILNSADFGVPQKRERVFIVGFKKQSAFDNFTFPVPTVKEPVPLTEVLMKPKEVDPSFYFSQKAIDGLKKSRMTEKMNKGRYQNPNRPCNTVGAHLAKRSLNSTDPVLLTNGKPRMLTPREVARIQSFPERFTLHESKTHSYRALGNAVPPVVMWHLGKNLLAVL